ncbi:hypothetical protein CY35_11G061200 [Sphagnum magellanicum]|nr:hypothetical protein CY35_11G061200 [Sphagnum magellanicum]
MERLVKKFEQRYRRARCHLATWSDLQSRLLKQFSNAASILDRLPVLGEVENYGILKEVKSMAQVLPASQIESFEKILSSIHSTLGEMEIISKSLEKLWCDGTQLLKSEKPTRQQAQQCLGAQPSLNDCIDGLHSLYTMHHDEYMLKVAIVKALSYNSSSEDMAALQSVLSDQPNIPPDEVQHIFDVIAAGDVW